MPAPDRYAFGDFVLERSQQRVLHRDGTLVNLTPRLFSALLLLAERAGELLDKDTLMLALWPGLVVEENNLSQVISGLRRALGDDTQGSRYIQTVPRRGFRFIATVTELADEAAPATAPVDVPGNLPDTAPGTTPAMPAAAAPPAAPPPAQRGRRQSDKRRSLQVLLAAGLAAGLAGAGWWSGAARAVVGQPQHRAPGARRWRCCRSSRWWPRAATSCSKSAWPTA